MPARSSKAKSVRRPSSPFRPLPHELPALLVLSRRYARADRAKVLLAIREYVTEFGFLPDPEGDYLEVVEGIARGLYGRKPVESQAALNAIDEALGHAGHKGQSAYDVAVDYGAMMLEAGVVFGLTLGIALAQNGGAR